MLKFFMGNFDLVLLNKLTYSLPSCPLYYVLKLLSREDFFKNSLLPKSLLLNILLLMCCLYFF